MTFSLSEQLQDSYALLWASLNQEYHKVNQTSNTHENDTRVLLDRLRSIKNYLVGSKARKSFTTSDPSISKDLSLLASILDWDGLGPCIIKLKIEAAAILGLLSISEDQAVDVLLQARLPAVILNAITRLLTEVPIQSLLSSQSPPRNGQHHLLQTLLRTLSSLYSIIQDVSSPRKWGFMTKSPERVHLPQPQRSTPRNSHASSIQFHHQEAKLDSKGKAKAPVDLGKKIHAHPSSKIQVDEPSHTFDYWPTSKPSKLKEACEEAKTLLAEYIVHENTLVPFILTISKRSMPDGSRINLSSVSIADLVVPCFQLIWLLCKDTKRQAWLIRELIEAEDPHGDEDSCLKALTNCLEAWLHSHHDLATEYAIRTVGALLSIDEPPHDPQDYELLEYLDRLLWNRPPDPAPSSFYSNPNNPTASPLEAVGIGWVLTRRSQRGSPILRAALATSINSLVKHFPDIRLRILLSQIKHTIELIDNTSYPIVVRCEAAYALAHSLTISENLHHQAYEANAIPVLKKLIDQASVDPIPYPTPAFVTQSAMLRESAYLALASLMSTLDAPRKQVIALNLLPGFVKALTDASILVRAASCQCCRALSRAISIVRTKLADEGAGSRLFDLAFGLDHLPVDALAHSSHQDNLEDDLDEDAVEIQLRIIAMGALCNLVLEFSPMKSEVLSRNGVEKFIKLLKFSKYQSLRESALWGLKNIIFSSSFQLKLRVITCLGWDEVFKCLNDKNLSIQENMISFLRNLACGEISDIDIVFKQLTNSNADSTHSQLIDLLEDKLSMSCSRCAAPVETKATSSAEAPEMSSRQTSSESVITDASKEQILIQTIYTFSNIATGNLVHKAYVLERPRIMKAVVDSLSHFNPEVQCAAIWCIINLTHFDEDTKPRSMMKTIETMESLEIPAKLRAVLRQFKRLKEGPLVEGGMLLIEVDDNMEDEKRRLGCYAQTPAQLEALAKRWQVKDRAECALFQILRKKDILLLS